MKNKDIYNGTYLLRTIEIKSKLFNDLQNSNVEYEKLDNLIKNKKTNEFYDRMKVVFQNDIDSKKAYDNLIKNYTKCFQKIFEFQEIEEFYSTFYKETQKKLIEKIKERIKQKKEKKTSEFLNVNNLLSDDKEFDYEKAKEDAKMLKYKQSYFFMAIYAEFNKNKKTEDENFKESISEFKKIFEEIIKHKEIKMSFVQMKNIQKLLNQLQNQNIDIKKEIVFLEAEFSYLNKEDYIKLNLEKDLNKFSKKYKILKLIKGIITFIEVFNALHEIKKTEFFDKLNSNFELIQSNEVENAQIINVINCLKIFGCDLDKEKSVLIFYETIFDKEESIYFIKAIKDNNFEIKNLNDFIDNSESELHISYIENLTYVYSFYIKLINNNKITTDKELIEIFNDKYIQNKNIAFHMQNYLESFEDIKNIYNSIKDKYKSNEFNKLSKLNNNIIKDKQYDSKKQKKELFEEENGILDKGELGQKKLFNINNINQKDEIYILNQKIKDLNRKLERYPFILNENENLLCIIFCTIDEKIFFPMICKNTDNIKILEKKIFQKYPEISCNENSFSFKGKTINKNQSLEKNKIKDGDMIIINQ